jgi:hypothetical protein
VFQKYLILMMVLLMKKIIFRNFWVTLGIAELLPLLFRKPFYDYNERWDTSTEVRE